MVASVRDHGVLQPVIAVATGDGRARVRFGHRRTRAALAAGRATVPVIVHPTSADADAAAVEIERMATQTQENTHRQGLTPAEQMDVFAGMAELGGLSAGQIAARTKMPRRDVAAGLRAARRPEVREAVAAAALTLEQGAALEEFSDQPEHYELLLDRLANPRSWGPGFEHTVQRLRDDRDEAATREALLAELTAAGTPVIEQLSFSGPVKRLIDLTDDPDHGPAEDHDPDDESVGERELDDDEYEEDDGRVDAPQAGGPEAIGPAPITPEAHAGCPGHAVYVSTALVGSRRRPQAVAVYVCTDPLGNGHRSRTGGLLREASEPTGPRAGESAQEAEDREAAEKAAKSAARRRVIAGNKAWDSATTVRRRWLAELLTRRTPPKAANTWVAGAFVADRYTVCRAAERGHRTAAELLCPEPAEGLQPDHERILGVLDGAGENRAAVVTLGLVLGAIDGETHRGQWRWNEDNTRRASTAPSPQQFAARADASLVRYLEALAGWGYPLSPIERLAIGEDVDDSEVFDAPSVGADAEGDTSSDVDGEHLVVEGGEAS